MEDLKAGLWEKKSQKGTTYYGGKVKIDKKEYKILLFKVGEKKNDKQPDYNIILKEEKEEKKENNSDKVFEEFGKGIDISDEEIAF